MERDEIIKSLYYIKNWKCNSDAEMYEVIESAIRLLEQPDTTSDTISRQSAMEACMKYNGHGSVWACIMEDIKMLPSARPKQKWIPCSERLPEEDHWLGGSGRQFSDEVLVSVANYDDEDIWTYISQTIDGEWALELPSHCKIIAWMPLPTPYREGEQE